MAMAFAEKATVAQRRTETGHGPKAVGNDERPGTARQGKASEVADGGIRVRVTWIVACEFHSRRDVGVFRARIEFRKVPQCDVGLCKQASRPFSPLQFKTIETFAFWKATVWRMVHGAQVAHSP